MLIFAKPGSPHHYSTKFHGPVKVLLNGEYVRYVVEADDEVGYIVRTQRGEDGRILHRGGDILHERVEGVVTFEGIRRGDV